LDADPGGVADQRGSLTIDSRKLLCWSARTWRTGARRYERSQALWIVQLTFCSLLIVAESSRRQIRRVELVLATFWLIGLITCLAAEQESDAWLRATEQVAKEEWNATNGMAWPRNASAPETVMRQGTKIIARSAQGEITVRAGAGFERHYTWEGVTRSAKLRPRANRWYGSLGIYYPGAGEHWAPNGGITRGVLEEGTLWFKTEADFSKWIRRRSYIPFVYSDDGLLIGWTKIPTRKQLNVEVWQVMIDGRKPTKLEGSQKDAIVVTRPD